MVCTPHGIYDFSHKDKLSIPNGDTVHFNREKFRFYN